MVPDAEAEVVQDTEDPATAPEYVEVVDPFAPEISFLRSDCPERKVIKVVCDQLGNYSSMMYLSSDPKYMQGDLIAAAGRYN